MTIFDRFHREETFKEAWEKIKGQVDALEEQGLAVGIVVQYRMDDERQAMFLTLHNISTQEMIQKLQHFQSGGQSHHGVN